MTGRRSRMGEVKDLLLYVLIAVGAVTGVVLLASTELEGDPVFKWLGFVVVTALVFGDAVRTKRRHWKERRFWVLLGVFLAVQTGLGILVLSAVTQVSALQWGIFYLLDHALLAAYLAHVLRWRHN